MSCSPAAARARTLTIANGVFKFAAVLPANAAVGVFVCAHGLFEDGGHGIMVSGPVVDAGSIDLARTMTGLSIHDGDRVSAGPLTISWDAVPEATSYCVVVYSTAGGYQGPSCLPGVMGTPVSTNRFTTPPLGPGQYTAGVVAFTDVVVGRPPNKPLVFTVGP